MKCKVERGQIICPYCNVLFGRCKEDLGVVKKMLTDGGFVKFWGLVSLPG